MSLIISAQMLFDRDGRCVTLIFVEATIHVGLRIGRKTEPRKLSLRAWGFSYRAPPLPPILSLLLATTLAS